MEWNTFKNTGSIDSYLELVEVENIEKNIAKNQEINKLKKDLSKKDIEELKDKIYFFQHERLVHLFIMLFCLLMLIIFIIFISLIISIFLSFLVSRKIVKLNISSILKED